jgi:hypothetical protein
MSAVALVVLFARAVTVIAVAWVAHLFPFSDHSPRSDGVPEPVEHGRPGAPAVPGIPTAGVGMGRPTGLQTGLDGRPAQDDVF